MKKIEIEEVKRTKHYVTFQLKSMTHFGDEFGDAKLCDSNSFRTGSMECMVKSRDYNNFSYNSEILWLPCNKNYKKKFTCKVSNKNYEIITRAIDVYNEHFKDFKSNEILLMEDLKDFDTTKKHAFNYEDIAETVLSSTVFDKYKVTRKIEINDLRIENGIAEFYLYSEEIKGIPFAGYDIVETYLESEVGTYNSPVYKSQNSVRITRYGSQYGIDCLYNIQDKGDIRNNTRQIFVNIDNHNKIKSSCSEEVFKHIEYAIGEYNDFYSVETIKKVCKARERLIEAEFKKCDKFQKFYKIRKDELGMFVKVNGSIVRVDSILGSTDKKGRTCTGFVINANGVEYELSNMPVVYDDEVYRGHSMIEMMRGLDKPQRVSRKIGDKKKIHIATHVLFEKEVY